MKGWDLMKKKTKCLAAAAILAGGLLAAAIYTRPRTIAQRYPFLDLDQCTQTTDITVKEYRQRTPDSS